MKKINFSFLIAILFMAAFNISLVSCSDDDEPDSSTLFMEPCLRWGTGTTVVKNFMNEKGFTLSYESDDGLAYNGKYKEAMTVYVFADYKLSIATVILSASKVTYNDIKDFLSKKYDYLGYNTEEEVDMFETSDGKTVIGLTQTSDDSGKAFYVTYMDIRLAQNAD